MESPVRKWRKSLGMSQRELAEAASVSQAHISKVENGRMRVQGALAEYLQNWRRDYGVAEIVEKQFAYMSFVREHGDGLTVVGTEAGCDEDAEGRGKPIDGLLGVLFPQASVLTDHASALINEAIGDTLSEGEAVVLSNAAHRIYHCIQWHFPVQDNYMNAGDWVSCRVLADVPEIREAALRKLGDIDFDDAWRVLVESGVVEPGDDGITLPFWAGKEALLRQLQTCLGRGFEHIESIKDDVKKLSHDLDDTGKAIVRLKTGIDNIVGEDKGTGQHSAT